jgi:phosphoglycolate phosphatase-like HAD superfamily hydrolase
MPMSLGPVTNPWVFDCDGVILDSNRIKTDAFRVVIERNYNSSLAQKMVDYHVANGGISRFKKFDWFLNQHVQFDANNLRKLCIEYGDAVKLRLLDAPLVPGVLEFLELLKAKSNDVFVVSGGLQDELRFVFQERELAPYFTGIFGSPKDKVSILSDLSEKGFNLENGVFFGDAKADYVAAQQHNMKFVFVEQFSEARAWFEQEQLNAIKIGKKVFLSIVNFLEIDKVY